MAGGLVRIGQVAERLGLSLRTIRHVVADRADKLREQLRRQRLDAASSR